MSHIGGSREASSSPGIDPSACASRGEHPANATKSSPSNKRVLSWGTGGNGQNAIVVFLRGQLEASQAKRRKIHESILERATATTLAVPQGPNAHPVSPLSFAPQQQQSLTLSRVQGSANDNSCALTLPVAPNLKQPQSRLQTGHQSLPPQDQALLQQLQQVQQEKPEAKLQENSSQDVPQHDGSTELDAKFSLHRVCRLFANQKCVVETCLTLDPDAIRRPSPVPPKKVSSEFPKACVPQMKTLRRLEENYSYPINIAIQNGASLEVLELLVNKGPDVLLKKDGHGQAGSLSIALTHKPRDLEMIEEILYANVQTIMVNDCRHNSPLHVACAKGSSLDVLRRLYLHYPTALLQKNLAGDTPLDIARRSTLIDETSLNFLLAKYNEGCMQVARNRLKKRVATAASSLRPVQR